MSAAGRTTGVVLALALGLSARDVRAERETIDRVVAVVEDEAVFLSDVQHRMRPFASELEQIGDPNARARRRSEMLRETLDQMVDLELIRRAARRANVTVSDEDVDRMVRSIAEQRGASPEDIYAAVAQTGMSRDEYRDFIRSDVLRLRVLNVRVRGRVNITENDIAEEYRRRVRVAESRAPFEAAHIFLAFPPAATGAQIDAVRARAEALHARLAAGEDFARLAREASDDEATREQGGSLGTIDPSSEDAAPPEWLVNAVRELSPGQFSAPARGENGYHLFRLVSRDTPTLPALSQVHDVLQNELLNREMLRQQQAYLRELRRRTNVEIRL